MDVDEEAAPRCQQYRIFDAAHAAYAVLQAALEPEELLAAIATTAALDLGGVMRTEANDDFKAFAYLNDTIQKLYPEVRKAVAQATAGGRA